jgi:hypothetical protein
VRLASQDPTTLRPKHFFLKVVEYSSQERSIPLHPKTNSDSLPSAHARKIHSSVLVSSLVSRNVLQQHGCLVCLSLLGRGQRWDELMRDHIKYQGRTCPRETLLQYSQAHHHREKNYTPLPYLQTTATRPLRSCLRNSQFSCSSLDSSLVSRKHSKQHGYGRLVCLSLQEQRLACS